MTYAGHEVDCTEDPLRSCIASLGAGRPAEDPGRRIGDGVTFDPARSQVFPGIPGGYPTVMPLRAGSVGVLLRRKTNADGRSSQTGMRR